MHEDGTVYTRWETPCPLIALESHKPCGKNGIPRLSTRSRAPRSARRRARPPHRQRAGAARPPAPSAARAAAGRALTPNAAVAATQAGVREILTDVAPGCLAGRQAAVQQLHAVNGNG